ncbi:MAG: GNAT family N-acetyltransferase [Clostridiales Family XIII bacterium]|nr:GNAT family N-acetyltransferase [Clostridiales Family XIII bacterium]
MYLVPDDDVSAHLLRQNIHHYTIRGDRREAVGYCWLVTDAALALRTGNIGYYITPAHRGQGYAARALDRMIDLAKRKGLISVTIFCEAENAASLGILRKLAERRHITEERAPGRRIRLRVHL